MLIFSEIPMLCILGYIPIQKIEKEVRMMNANKYLYTAVIKKTNGNEYYSYFPDFPGCTAYGQNLEEIIRKTQTSLTIYISMCLQMEDSFSLPKPTDYHEIQRQFPSDIIQLIPADMSKNAVLNMLPVKKTLTIPTWLDSIAKKYNICFSHVLQKAIIDTLKNRSDLTEKERYALFAENNLYYNNHQKAIAYTLKDESDLSEKKLYHNSPT